MGKWEISSEAARDVKAVEKWGAEEWERRKQVCKQKRDELEAEDGWEARIIIGNQFESIVKALDQDKFDVMATFPARKWRCLVEKIILG